MTIINYPKTVEDTIKVLMTKGLSKDEAIREVESKLRGKIPREIKERLND